MSDTPKIELPLEAALRLHKVLEYWHNNIATMGEHFNGLLDLAYLRGYTAGEMQRVLAYRDMTNREMA